MGGSRTCIICIYGICICGPVNYGCAITTLSFTASFLWHRCHWTVFIIPGVCTRAIYILLVSMFWDVGFFQGHSRFSARSPVGGPAPAVDEPVPQVRRAVRPVAQVPLFVNQPRIFVNRVAVVKRTGVRCYSSWQYPPPDFVTINFTVPSVVGVMCYASCPIAIHVIPMSLA